MGTTSIPPEGPECEWKEILPRTDRVARTLAAFANGVGGDLWVGIRDDGRRMGITDAKQVMADVQAAVELCDPRPTVRAQRYKEGELTLIVATVQPTKPGPTAVTMEDGKRRVFVRDGSSTRPAEEATLRRMRRQPVVSRTRLDDRALRVLALFKKDGPLTSSQIARSARLGRQATKRVLVDLTRAGFVQEVQGGRLSLTPSGHRKLNLRGPGGH